MRAPATPAVPVSPAFESKNSQTCASLGKLNQSLSAQELYAGLLRLVTRGEWIVDRSGTLVSGTALQNLIKDRSIPVYGFTNKDADATGSKVYDNLYPLSHDLGVFYDTVSPGGVVSYLEVFQPKFLGNLASAYSIRNWRIKSAQMIRVTDDQLSRDPVGSIRYRFTFEAPGGNNISFDFSPTDRIYFCSYESADEERQKLLSENARIVGPVRLMAEYKLDLPYADIPCPPVAPSPGLAEAKLAPRSPTTVQQLVRSILLLAQRAGAGWVVDARDKTGVPTAWKARSMADAKAVNSIMGYKYGVPTLEPTQSDNVGLRLTRIERVPTTGSGVSIWKLTLAQVNRKLFFNTPTIDVYVTSDDVIGLC